MASLPPTITAVTPSSGPSAGGTTIVLTGQHFTGMTVLQFGSVEALSFTVNSDSQITAVSPAQSSGPVSIGMAKVANSQLYGNGAFTYM
jgi:large repetitive protein